MRLVLLETRWHNVDHDQRWTDWELRAVVCGGDPTTMLDAFARSTPELAALDLDRVRKDGTTLRGTVERYGEGLLLCPIQQLVRHARIEEERPTRYVYA